MIILKTSAEIEQMRRAGSLVGQVLEKLREHVVPGASTRELDAVAEGMIRSRGGVPSFKGYRGYPASICASVNNEIIHGIPGDRTLAEGDIVSIDCGAILGGFHPCFISSTTTGRNTRNITASYRRICFCSNSCCNTRNDAIQIIFSALSISIKNIICIRT